MEANLEEPIDLDELAVYVAVSRRQLERLFQKYLHCSPSRYYLKLRLIRARQLLKQTPMSIIEVASVCGFVSTPHFSKCYREYFGIPPRDERVGSNTTQQVAMMPIPQALVLSPLSGPMSALSQARNESRSNPVPFTRINVMMHADLIDQDDLLGQLRSLGFEVSSGATAEQACECAVRGLSEARAKALKGMVEQMYTGSATILPAVRQAIDKQLLPALVQFKQNSGA